MSRNSKMVGPQAEEPTGHLCASCVHIEPASCAKLKIPRRKWQRSCNDYERHSRFRSAPRKQRSGECRGLAANVRTEWVDRPCMQCTIKPYERPVGSDYHMCSACRERVNNRANACADEEDLGFSWK